MIKRALVYGLAFGSAAAALVLIQYYNGLYKERSIVSALPVLGSVVLVGLGVLLFIRSLVRQTEKPVNMGTALFGSLLVGLVMAICTIAAYQHVYNNRKDIITDFVSSNLKAVERTQEITNIKDSVARKVKLDEYKVKIEDGLKPSSFSLPQIVMFLSTSMVMALFSFLRVFQK